MAFIKPEVTSSLTELNNELVDVITKRKAVASEVITVLEILKASVLEQYAHQLFYHQGSKFPVKVIPKPKK